MTSIDDKFDRCEGLYVHYTFVYYFALVRDCDTPITSEIAHLKDAQERFASTMAQEPLDQFSQVVGAIEEQAALERRAQLKTRLFEDSVMDGWTVLCDPSEKRGLISAFESPKNKRLGLEALGAQMQSYFELRDFIFPEIDQMKARLAVIARSQFGQSSPPQLIAKSNELSSTLEQAFKYRYKLPPTPLRFAYTKNLLSRDFSVTGLGKDYDYAEAQLWDQLFRSLTFATLSQHKLVIDRLVNCGAFRATMLTSHFAKSPDGFYRIEGR